MNRKEDFIAVFDSGVGGISVLRHLVKLLPGERILYYGDSANAPYGTRTRQEVTELTFAAVRHLMEKGLKALVLGCNTATSAAVDQLRSAYPDLIIVGIEPALKPAADRFPGGRIGVMATEMTLREEKFSQLLERYRQKVEIIKLPATGLVELVEAGEGNSPRSQSLLKPILEPWCGRLDAVVLGCTHFPFAAETIAGIMGPGTVLLDGGEGTAREALRRLRAADLLENGEGQVLIENSNEDPALIRLSRSLLEK